MKQKNSLKVAFLDRDGVINKKAADYHYILSPDEFVFNSAIFDIAMLLQEKDYKIIVITNQRGIARGLMTESDLISIHQKMIDSFNKKGISIFDVLYCPHDENSCDCRKPKDGMLRLAFSKHDIDKEKSLLISDSKHDITMGETFGIYSLFVPSDVPEVALAKIYEKN